LQVTRSKDDRNLAMKVNKAATASSRVYDRANRGAFLHNRNERSLRKSHIKTGEQIIHLQAVDGRPTTDTRSTLLDDFDSESLIPRTDEPSLFNLPSTQYPEYKSVPSSVKLVIGFMSIFINLKLNRPINNSVFGLIRNAKFIKLLLKTVATYALSIILTQDAFYMPSRIDTPTLLRNNWLPSSLSKYSTVSATVPLILSGHDSDTSIGPIGVHFLEYRNIGKNFKFDAIHFNHGFGASSLSWLPAIPNIVNRLGGKVGIAHDAPGFGFTDRPPTTGVKDSLIPYSAAGSASLGNALLTSRIQEENSGAKDDEISLSQKRVALFGHSMGCAVTLRMAIALPPDVEKVIILVSPALIGKIPSNFNESTGELPLKTALEVDGSLRRNSVMASPGRQFAQIRLWAGIFTAAFRRGLVDPCLAFLLRRLVGKAKFWSKGLRLVWANPDLVTDNDSLRYQWPSIGLGWEKGLLAFTRSRLTTTCTYSFREIELLSDVVNMPNTKVVIVHGSKDNVVPPGMSQQITDTLEKIILVEALGEGHNPFEENLYKFIETIETKL